MRKELIKVYCKHIPLAGYYAITILVWMVVRACYRFSLPTYVDNHENIHYAQEREMGFVGFYLWYALEYIIKLALTWSHRRAYASISLEQEAYRNQNDSHYLNNRRHFAWLRYVFKLKTKEQ